MLRRPLQTEQPYRFQDANPGKNTHREWMQHPLLEPPFLIATLDAQLLAD
jgi:hypothetical protein